MTLTASARATHMRAAEERYHADLHAAATDYTLDLAAAGHRYARRLREAMDQLRTDQAAIDTQHPRETA
jgi:hypothetical protein